MLPEYYTDLLRQRFAGRKLLLAYDKVAAAPPRVKLLRELGVQRPLLLAMDEGAGPQPDAGDLDWLVLGKGPHAHVNEELRAYERTLADLPPEARSAVERFDPRGEALAMRTFTLGLDAVAGRRVYGAKRPEWLALEDKVVIDSFWDEVGIPRAPSRVVSVRDGSWQRAALELDRGDGTVWAGDAREGWHGGGIYLRWVRDAEEGRAAITFFAGSCDRVRVMPFLAGIPCSIHGMVFPDGTIALRPVELVVFRRPDRDAFLYAGCATFWDPPDADREAMRDLARRAGEGLRRKVGFRGAFTVDGVLTAEGFLPTELNPRFGAGLMTMARAVPELPIELLDLAVIEGEAWDFRSDELEAWLLERADAVRSGGGWTTTRRRAGAEVDRALVLEQEGIRWAEEGEVGTGRLLVGAASGTSFVRFTPDPDRVERGPSIAPLVARVFAFCDAELGTSFGGLLSAEDAH